MKGSESRFCESRYTNDIYRAAGIRIWYRMVNEILDSRELIWILAKRNVSVKYRQSLLSYLWVVIPPLVAVGLFSYLAGNRIINIGATPIPYLSYALLNLTLWLLFSNTLLAASKSLVEAGSLVTRANFSKVSLIFASAADALLEFVVRMIAVTAIFCLQGVAVAWQTVFALFFLLPLMLMATGLGLIFSIMNMVIRDIVSFLGIALTLWMLLTPVLYPSSFLEEYPLIYTLNPINPIIENVYSLISDGVLINKGMLFATSLLAGMVFLLSWRIFYLTLPRVCERA